MVSGRPSFSLVSSKKKPSTPKPSAVFAALARSFSMMLAMITKSTSKGLPTQTS